jgi:hypothetical protein
VMPWRAKNRDSALRLAEIRRLCSIETSSFNVRSRCLRIRARICGEYFYNLTRVMNVIGTKPLIAAIVD